MSDHDPPAAAWQRYWPTADIVLEFDAPVALIDRYGRGRVTRAQHIKPRERFQYLRGIPDE